MCLPFEPELARLPVRNRTKRSWFGGLRSTGGAPFQGLPAPLPSQGHDLTWETLCFHDFSALWEFRLHWGNNPRPEMKRGFHVLQPPQKKAMRAMARSPARRGRERAKAPDFPSSFGFKVWLPQFQALAAGVSD